MTQTQACKYKAPQDHSQHWPLWSSHPLFSLFAFPFSSLCILECRGIQLGKPKFEGRNRSTLDTPSRIASNACQEYFSYTDYTYPKSDWPFKLGQDYSRIRESCHYLPKICPSYSDRCQVYNGICKLSLTMIIFIGLPCCYYQLSSHLQVVPLCAIKNWSHLVHRWNLTLLFLLLMNSILYSLGRPQLL